MDFAHSFYEYFSGFCGLYKEHTHKVETMTGLHQSSIMIVEDNSLLSESIMELLSMHGFNNLVAFSDVFNAVRYFRQKYPDLVILDAELQGLSGLEVLAEFKTIRPRLPVVMMSSHHDKDMLLRACASGANTFFPKPFDTDLFCRQIEDLLSHISFLD